MLTINNINDKKYKKIIKPIIRHSVFKETYNIEHHGISRMEHSLKVSYYSYKIALRLGLDYQSVARGGLLHDFYLCDNNRSRVSRFIDVFIHPKKTLATSKEYFNLNEIEENIIESHMFPLYHRLPKYKESIIVSLVDKFIGSKEMLKSFHCRTIYKFEYTVILLLIFITSN